MCWSSATPVGKRSWWTSPSYLSPRRESGRLRSRARQNPGQSNGRILFWNILGHESKTWLWVFFFFFNTKKVISLRFRRLWQNVTESLREKDIEKATEHKRLLEERQRTEERHRNETETLWRTRHFNKEVSSLCELMGTLGISHYWLSVFFQLLPSGDGTANHPPCHLIFCILFSHTNYLHVSLTASTYIVLGLPLGLLPSSSILSILLPIHSLSLWTCRNHPSPSVCLPHITGWKFVKFEILKFVTDLLFLLYMLCYVK